MKLLRYRLAGENFKGVTINPQFVATVEDVPFKPGQSECIVTMGDGRSFRVRSSKYAVDLDIEVELRNRERG